MRISDWSSDVCSSDLNHVDEVTVVGDVRLHVRMWPIGPPQHTVRIAFNDWTDDCGKVVPRIAYRGEAVVAGHLWPDLGLLFDQLLEGAYLRTFVSFAHRRASHMIDDDDRRDRLEERHHLVQDVRLEIDDDVPTERFDLLGHLQELVLGRVAHQALQEIESYAANAAGVQRLQFRNVHGRINNGDSPTTVARPGNGIEGRAVVRDRKSVV